MYVVVPCCASPCCDHAYGDHCLAALVHAVFVCGMVAPVHAVIMVIAAWISLAC